MGKGGKAGRSYGESHELSAVISICSAYEYRCCCAAGHCSAASSVGTAQLLSGTTHHESSVKGADE